MRNLVFLLLIVLSGTCGQIAVTRAMKRIGEVHDFSPLSILSVLGRAFRIGWMWFGFLLMALSFFCLLLMLSWANVSFVVPATALGYGVGAVGARVFLKEHVSGLRWIGVIVVSLGVILVYAG